MAGRPRTIKITPVFRPSVRPQDAKSRLKPRQMGPTPPLGRPGASCGVWRPSWQRSRTSPKPHVQNPSIAGWDYRSPVWDKRDSGMLERDKRDGGMLPWDAHTLEAGPLASGSTAGGSTGTAAGSIGTTVTRSGPPTTFPRQNRGHPHARTGPPGILRPRRRGSTRRRGPTCADGGPPAPTEVHPLRRRPTHSDAGPPTQTGSMRPPTLTSHGHPGLATPPN